MNQIPRFDWLPEHGAILPARDYSLVPARSKIFFGVLSHIMNPLLTKLVRSRWLDIGQVLFFCVFMDRDEVEVNKHAKKELGQYPAILTEQAW